MSYILDALNKSEREAQAPAIPDITSLTATPGSSNHARWWLLGGALIAINVAAVTWFMIGNRTVSPAPGKDAIISTATPVVPAEPARATPAISPTRATTPVARKVRPAVTHISALPLAVQRQIPDMTFSSHIFAGDADLRMVAINNQMLQEGDQINADIHLLRITEEGVVLEFREQQISLSVLQDWQSP